MSVTPSFKYLVYWARNYGNAGIVDQRAVTDFMDCETDEPVRGLRFELQLISEGNYLEETLVAHLGPQRREKHGSFEDWARMMLLWMASYKV